MLGIFPPRPCFLFFFSSRRQTSSRPHLTSSCLFPSSESESLQRCDGNSYQPGSASARGQINPLLLHSRHSLNWYVASVQILMCTLHSNQWAEDSDFSVQQRHQKQARLVRLRDYHCLHFQLEMNQLAKESIWALSGVSTHPPTHAHTHMFKLLAVRKWDRFKNRGSEQSEEREVSCHQCGNHRHVALFFVQLCECVCVLWVVLSKKA